MMPRSLLAAGRIDPRQIFQRLPAFLHFGRREEHVFVSHAYRFPVGFTHPLNDQPARMVLIPIADFRNVGHQQYRAYSRGLFLA